MAVCTPADLLHQDGEIFVILHILVILSRLMQVSWPSNLRFVDDIDGLAGQEQELVKLVNHTEEASAAYGMQISAEKTQLMTNNTNGISTDITIDNKKLETVRSFKYLGAIVSDEGSNPEVLSRIAKTTAAMTKVKVIWTTRTSPSAPRSD